MRALKDSCRVVVFRVHSPFTTFLTALIGKFYYEDAKRVALIPVGFNAAFQEGMLESGLFDEIYIFHDAGESVSSVEQEVDKFLNRYPKIDEYFFNTLHDRFGYLLARRLHGKTLVNFYPEGCGNISFQESQKVGMQEFYARFPYMNQFYQKYPLDFQVIDAAWNFDGELQEKNLEIQVKTIELQKLLFLGENEVKQLNTLFHFSDTTLESYDAFYLDDGIVEKNRMDAHAEKVILDELFADLSGKKVLVKPHPGQSGAYTNFQFADRNVDILLQVEIPWELIYLNLLRRKTQKKVVLIMFAPTTAVYSSIHIAGEDKELIVLSLENLKKPYIEPSITRSSDNLARYYDYVLKDRSNIRIYTPDSFKALQEACAQIFDGRITVREPMEDCALSAISPAQFFRVGNLLAKSRIYEKHSGKMYEALFDFLNETSEIDFPIDAEVDFSTLEWWPDESNMFFNFKDLQVYTEGRDGQESLIYAEEDSGEETMTIENGGRVTLSIPYRGFCKRLRIRVKLRTREAYNQLTKMYENTRWRAAFWENWYDIQTSDDLQAYVQKAGIREVWIFGNGKIGTLIKSAFDALGVSTKFLATKGKKESPVRVYGIEELSLEMGKADAVIITPMWDYAGIVCSLPPDVRKKALSLEEFTSAVLNSRTV